DSSDVPDLDLFRERSPIEFGNLLVERDQLHHLFAGNVRVKREVIAVLSIDVPTFGNVRAHQVVSEDRVFVAEPTDLARSIPVVADIKEGQLVNVGNRA